MKKILCTKILVIIFIHLLAFTSHSAAPDISSRKSCIELYSKKIRKKSIFLSKKYKEELQKSLDLFFLLEHPDTTFEKIAPEHYNWWVASEFSRWPFFYLLAIYRSDELCNKKYYTLENITSQFENFAQNPKVAPIIKEQTAIFKKAEEKRLREKKDQKNHAIRSEIITFWQRENIDIYSLYPYYDEWQSEHYHPPENSCPVCYESYEELPTLNPIPLLCGHSFCRNCITEHINVTIHDQKAQIKCLNHECNEDLKVYSHEVFALSPAQEFLLCKNIITYEMARRKDYYIGCVNKNCAHIFYTGEPFPKYENLYWEKCPYCDTKACFKCLTIYKRNHVCSDALSKQKTLEKEIRANGNYMDCPYCGTWHEKITGCSYVTCSSCKKPFDFATGGPWNIESQNRQRRHKKGFHRAARINDARIIKDKNELVDGGNKW